MQMEVLNCLVLISSTICTSTDRSNIANEITGFRELESDPTMKVHIEGTAQDRVEIHVKVGENRKMVYRKYLV